MRKIIYISFFIYINLFGAGHQAYSIESNNPLHVHYNVDEPIIFGFNFFVKKAGVIAEKNIKIQKTLLPKGVVLIVGSKKAKGVLTVVNEKGDNYLIVFAPGGKNSSFNIVDENYQIQKTKTQSIEKIGTKVERDMQYLIKNISLGKVPKGYSSVYSPTVVKAKNNQGRVDYILNRYKRYIGQKYVVDLWSGINLSDREIFLKADDFYTKGILAISFDKDIVKALGKFNIIIVINKVSLLKR